MKKLLIEGDLYLDIHRLNFEPEIIKANIKQIKNRNFPLKFTLIQNI
jgi:hypothetical protein